MAKNDMSRLRGGLNNVSISSALGADGINQHEGRTTQARGLNGKVLSVSENEDGTPDDDHISHLFSDDDDDEDSDSRLTPPSSSPEPEDVPNPWANSSDEQRKQVETTFTMQTYMAINGSLKTTEAYVLSKDEEMLQYLQHYPTKHWLIGSEAGVAAYRAMLDRANLRARGKSIFSRGRSRWWPLRPTRKQLAPTLIIAEPPQPPPVQQVASTFHEAYHMPPQAPPGQSMYGHPVPGQHMPAQPMPGHAMQYISPFPMVHPFPNIPSNFFPVDAPSAPVNPPSPSVWTPPMGHQPPAGFKSTWPGMQAPFRAADARLYTRPQPHPTTSTLYSTRPSHDLRIHQMRPSARYPSTQSQTSKPKKQPEGKEAKAPKAQKPRAPSNATPAAKATPLTITSVSRSDTPPPYPRRPRPVTAETPKTGKGQGRRTGFRKRADDPIFPWQREWAAEKPTPWDDSIYPTHRLVEMEALRERNRPKIMEYEAQQIIAKQEKDRANGNSSGSPAVKSKLKNLAEESEIATITKSSPRKSVKFDAKSMSNFDAKPKATKARRNGDPSEGGDPYHAGRIRFGSEVDAMKSQSKGYEDVEAAVEAAMANPDDTDFTSIMATYDPGKRPIVDLEIAQISIMDIARTRLQLASIRVLSKLTAERIIDFCPDMLWQERLLQIVSESGVGNKDLAFRLGLNGAYIVVSSIAHRISAALGKKQSSSAYGEGEKQWFLDNQNDFNKYKSWRGVRPASYGTQSRTSLIPESDKKPANLKKKARRGKRDVSSPSLSVSSLPSLEEAPSSPSSETIDVAMKEPDDGYVEDSDDHDELANSSPQTKPASVAAKGKRRLSGTAAVSPAKRRTTRHSLA